MKDTMIGVDLAKNVFQLHGASMTGEVKFCKKLTRAQFMAFMADHPAAVVVMEACGSSSYWARELSKAGHEVKLLAPQYGKRRLHPIDILIEFGGFAVGALTCEVMAVGA
jgi:transposase